MFTDGEFSQINPMWSKLEASTILDRIKRNAGLANEIFMENAPEKTGYNI